jgi:hypothetical protein
MQYLVEWKLAAYGRPTGAPMVMLRPRLERLIAKLQNGPAAAI